MSEKMNKTERLAVTSLAAIMALRLMGLFMIVPIFSLYSKDLIGSTPLLIGMAVGIYGLTQGLFQIPFGMLSDRWGRKPIISLGLILFAAGSLIAALSHAIFLLIIGRALQGAGAIGSTTIAFISDLTREDQRTKAMAINGMTIGLSFCLAMMIGPILAVWFKLNGLFGMTVFFRLLAIFILWKITPSTPLTKTSTQPIQFFQLLKLPQLARLNLSVFFLHAIFTATFVVVPIALKQSLGFNSSHQWTVYLPSLVSAFALSFFIIFLAEKKRQLKTYFLIAIILLGISEVAFLFLNHGKAFAIAGLILFFTAFSILEAFLPSWVSRAAPEARKGTALGIYSSSQFLGIFVGGWIGGFLYGHFSLQFVYLFCALVAIVWLPIAMGIQSLRYSKSPSHTTR